MGRFIACLAVSGLALGAISSAKAADVDSTEAYLRCYKRLKPLVKSGASTSAVTVEGPGYRSGWPVKNSGQGQKVDAILLRGGTMGTGSNSQQTYYLVTTNGA